MKKIVAMMLALAMVLAMTAALAVEGQPDSGLGTTSPITIKKGYVINGSDDADPDYPEHPADTITFTVDSTEYYFNGQKSSAATVPAIADADITVSTILESDDPATITIALPTAAYSKVGEYVYYLKETGNATAGVTYNYDGSSADKFLTLKVTVIKDMDSESATYGQLIIGGIALRQGKDPNPVEKSADVMKEKLDSAKGDSDNVHNEYEAGKLTVSKTVTGNMGDTDKNWIFKATFKTTNSETVRGTITIQKENNAVYVGETAPTADADGVVTPTAASADTILPGSDGWTTKTVYFTLRSGDKLTFVNVPEGVEWEVTEVEAGMYGYTTTAAASDTVVTPSTEDADATTDTAQTKGEITAAKQGDTADYTNTKTVDIDTGITLESVPYIMIMMIAMAGAAMMIARKRREEV